MYCCFYFIQALLNCFCGSAGGSTGGSTGGSGGYGGY